MQRAGPNLRVSQNVWLVNTPRGSLQGRCKEEKKEEGKKGKEEEEEKGDVITNVKHLSELCTKITLVFHLSSSLHLPRRRGR